MEQKANQIVQVLGLGYVGWPLALAFSSKFEVVGIDVDKNRLQDIAPQANKSLRLSDRPIWFESTNIFIITVPTPVKDDYSPDLSLVESAFESVAGVIKSGDYVILESTVFPGVTRSCSKKLGSLVCLEPGKDFFFGYSPERVSPGDNVYTLLTVPKLVAGCGRDSASFIKGLYEKALEGGSVHLVETIEIAEAAKLIENSQRDLNIGFVNELSKIFTLAGLDTHKIIEAASTKPNFGKYYPGLVGGHCIGVDPYYLSKYANTLGYIPEVIMRARKLNEEMYIYTADKLVKVLLRTLRNKPIEEIRVLHVGVTFKADCDDLRNSQNMKLAEEIGSFGFSVSILDPYLGEELPGFDIFDEDVAFDALVFAVPHQRVISKVEAYLQKHPKTILFDLHGSLNRPSAWKL